MSWVIRTQYFLYHVDSDEVPTKIVDWYFEVIEETPNHFVVLAQNRDDADIQMEFGVGKSTMSIEWQAFVFDVRGQRREMREEYQGQGMISQSARVGPVPIEMPYFPLGERRSFNYPFYVRGLSGLFEINVHQQEEQTEEYERVMDLVESPDDLVPAPESARYFIVLTELGDSEVLQIWADNVPWFLYNANTNSISWLIEY